jgi:hypothetical protein
MLVVTNESLVNDHRRLVVLHARKPWRRGGGSEHNLKENMQQLFSDNDYY